jgi:ureidoacrylate peracid hydrolase
MPLRFEIQVNKCALLVFDMAKDFVAPGGVYELPGARDIVPNLQSLIGFCRTNDIPIMYTQYIVREDLSNIGIIGEIWPEIKPLVQQRRGFIKGAEGIEVYDPIKPEPQDTIIQKTRYSAFAHTDLELVLKGKNRDTLIVTGVSTNIGPETTVRDAVLKDYKVVFVSDCTANNDIPDMGWGKIPAELAKRVSFSVLAQAFCRVMTSKELINELSQ